MDILITNLEVEYEVQTSSKTEADILLALHEFGHKFNRICRERAGPPAFKDRKYAHTDTDRPTCNVCCVARCK